MFERSPDLSLIGLLTLVIALPVLYLSIVYESKEGLAAFGSIVTVAITLIGMRGRSESQHEKDEEEEKIRKIP